MGVINFVKGIFIGIALVIPGLSGSMFAVVVGLYDGLLKAANEFRQDIKRHTLFLLPVLLGVAAGILCSTKVVLWVCEKYTFQSYAFFIGLVLGSVPLVYRKMTPKGFSAAKLPIMLAAFAAILYVSLFAAAGEDAAKATVAVKTLTDAADVGIVAFAGVFSCSLMAIPGVSGSVMLLLINQYGTVYHAVASIGDILNALFSGEFQTAAGLLPAAAIVLPFTAGAAVGLILIAKALHFLLTKFESAVYYGVMGLLCGAAVVLFKDGVFGGLSFRFDIGVTQGFSALLLALVCVMIGSFCTQVLDS
ncbi:MAG: DUF368 domain-containing protein [Clostridiales bacterium]|jgi:putative membrane protein|nr:DUF368 domain-containing protein [Clostridiales bacterium]